MTTVGKTVAVDVRYEAADFRRLQRPIIFWGLLFIFSFFTVLDLLAFFMLQYHPERAQPEGPLFYFWAPIALTLVLLHRFLRPRWQLWRAQRNQRSVVRYTVSETSFEIAFSTSSVKVLWKELTASSETKHDFRIYVSTGIIAIPKRCFVSPEQMTEFRETVATGLPDPTFREKLEKTRRNVWRLLWVTLLGVGLLLLLTYFRANP